jgi:hypothetical protein
MNSEEQNQDFEKLQHLLKLKRYEQPPPRYFNDFSSRVIAHIRTDSSVSRLETAENLISRTPWLRRLWRKLENQPALTGAFATVVCGLMVAGVFLMEETTPQNFNFTTAGHGSTDSDPSKGRTGLGDNFATVAAPPAFQSSTNLTPNLFEHLGVGLPGQPAEPALISRPILRP